MDKVLIKGLEVEAVIGVYDWERGITQKLVLDIELDWDNRPAARHDDLSLALDYDRLSQRLLAFIGASQYGLIETLAEETARLIHEEFAVPGVLLTLYKPGAVKAAQTVGVQIYRNYGQVEAQ
ncbi:dihydroneopterin aldolase [Gynuella sunshinyii]|uniref:7,8-dihydroneopterin aldolase n=1 Tax=Gynuella sunshinyii YC6258 TaxID=1445510 RepID=A0A0C5W2J7_9GAMM|nr:dihydroneopterin aldolase [Gynuella sunshinyii]AJQ96899.1 dihydroneopterin aldolase [Gynuella sunshinyii YC6258]